MNSWIYLLYFIFLIALARIYFFIARKYNIVDLPNHRTMHTDATIRGGGLVVFVGMMMFTLLLGSPSFYFLLGLFLMGVTGFLDDIIDLSSSARLVVQLLSMLLIISELDMWSLNALSIVLIVLIGAGALNAFNFMDGINGITGGYSFVAILSLLYVNIFIQPFIPNEFLLSLLLALIVFNIYNFRHKAVCFAGDVGSLSIAYIIIFLILKLIFESGQLIFLLFLTLYGIDTIFTIIQRLSRRENIFEAHRLHLFQVAISKTGKSHLAMSGAYMIVQLLVNIIVISTFTLSMADQMLYLGLLLFVLSLIYIRLKSKIMTEAK